MTAVFEYSGDPVGLKGAGVVWVRSIGDAAVPIIALQSILGGDPDKTVAVLAGVVHAGGGKAILPGEVPENTIPFLCGSKGAQDDKDGQKDQGINIS